MSQYNSIWPFRLFICFSLVLLAGIANPAAATAEDPDWTDLWVKGLRPYNMVADGLHQYYALYGRWPAAWADVREAGIIQVELYDAAGNRIDPDDRRVDSWGDVIYAGSDGSGQAIIRGRLLPSNEVSSKSLKPANPYQRRFRFDRSKLPEGAFDLSTLLADERWMKLCAMTGMLSRCINQFASCYERAPANLAEFMGSPFAPFDWHSVNPVTGQALRLDGSAGDIWVGPFETDPARLQDDGNLILPSTAPVLADGTICPYRSMY